MKASTPDDLIMFLESILPKVTGEPRFEYLMIIRRYLNTNLMIVSSYECGGLHGHLSIIMNNDKCFTVATDVFSPPPNPGTMAISVARMTAAQITEAKQARVEATYIYRTYHNMDQAFKKLVIDVFEDPFIKAPSNETAGRVNQTPLEFITHLLMCYAMITPTELTQIYERLTAPYDPNLPIDTLFQHIQDARAFAVAGG
jgi:hypothetical protein